MRLRNKKTGEIWDIGKVLTNDYPSYESLKQINADWEDYEEPIEHWCITMYGGITRIKDNEEPIDDLIEIGNYFNSKDDAYEAVEKLKAWKLLKDELDIKFDGIIRDDKAMLKAVKLSYDKHEVTFDRMRECVDALHLLFGGEE